MGWAPCSMSEYREEYDEASHSLMGLELSHGVIRGLLGKHLMRKGGNRVITYLLASV